jgi:hypothetical protein
MKKVVLEKQEIDESKIYAIELEGEFYVAKKHDRGYFWGGVVTSKMVNGDRVVFESLDYLLNSGVEAVIKIFNRQSDFTCWMCARDLKRIGFCTPDVILGRAESFKIYKLQDTNTVHIDDISKDKVYTYKIGSNICNVNRINGQYCCSNIDNTRTSSVYCSDIELTVRAMIEDNNLVVYESDTLKEAIKFYEEK